MPTPVDLRSAAAGSPEWWLRRLLLALNVRRATTDVWRRYYEGQQPLDFLSRTYREAFSDSFRRWAANFTADAVDALADRLEVQAFRFGSVDVDAEVWRVWQANRLDAGSQQAHLEALVTGVAYALVESAGPGAPAVITVESADDCITEADPRNRTRRLAGLKRYIDGDGFLVVIVYDAERVYRYRSIKAWSPTPALWPFRWPAQPNEWGELATAGFARLEVDGEDWGLEHRVGAVPLVPLVNRPRIDGTGRSEVEPLTTHQDAVNFYRTGALIASRYLAVPQRYVVNYREELNDAGIPIRRLKAAPQEVWTFPPRDDDPEGPEPRFDTSVGQFPAADLTMFTQLIEAEATWLANRANVPVDEVLASSRYVIPQSAEAIKSSEAPMLRKVGRLELFLGEGWEEVARTALRAAGDSSRADQLVAETLWVPAETRNEAVRADAVTKLHAAGVYDDELSWDLLGVPEAEQARMRLAQAARAALGEPPPTFPRPPAEELTPAPTGPRMGAG